MDEFELISAALAERTTTTKVFIRDDDAPWSLEHLEALAQQCVAFGLPIDVAVIPAAINPENASRMITLCDGAGSLRLHQHGYAHINHQVAGRKSEFGSDRNEVQQREDILRGNDLLRQNFGDRLDPIFTPPWNRCTAATLDALADAGISILSRITGSDLLTSESVMELPTMIDWQKKRNGKRLNSLNFCNYAAALINKFDITGVMLHHAEMDHNERSRFARFTGILAESGKVEFSSMMDLVVGPGASSQNVA